MLRVRSGGFANVHEKWNMVPMGGGVVLALMRSGTCYALGRGVDVDVHEKRNTLRMGRGFC